MGDRKILIAEDDSASAKLLEEVLKKENIQTVVAKNGAEALFYYFQDPHFDTVLLDMMMPEIGGEDFLKIIESIYLRKMLPKNPQIIILTAVANISFLNRLTNFECVQAVLNKPLNTKALLEQLRLIAS